MLAEMYTSGEYLEKWPTWHVEISPWSARQIYRMLTRNHLTPQSICEIGCGAGEILKQLQTLLPQECHFWGYEISPQAFELAKSRENERLHFKLADIAQEPEALFDLMLVIDVLEHVEDCFTFLRSMKPQSPYKILHIPLDLSVRALMRGALPKVREEHGHIHYFTKELALQMVREVGYEVIDYFYTSPAIDLPIEGELNECKRRLMRLPRKVAFNLRADLAVTLLGGWSLMILAR